MASDSDSDDGGCGFFNPDMFASVVEVESNSFRMGDDSAHPVTVELNCVHNENQFVERFVAQVVWPSAAALCNYILNHTQVMGDFSDGDATSRPVNVLELGSGTGLCGIGLAKTALVAKCALTDYKEEAIKLLDDNIKLNDLSDKCDTFQLSWGDEARAADIRTKLLGDASNRFDVCVGTDVVYEPESVPILFQSAGHFLPPGGRFLLANHTSRYAGLEHVVKEEAVKASFVETVMDSIPCEDGQVDFSIFTFTPTVEQ